LTSLVIFPKPLVVLGVAIVLKQTWEGPPAISDSCTCFINKTTKVKEVKVVIVVK